MLIFAFCCIWIALKNGYLRNAARRAAAVFIYRCNSVFVVCCKIYAKRLARSGHSLLFIPLRVFVYRLYVWHFSFLFLVFVSRFLCHSSFLSFMCCYFLLLCLLVSICFCSLVSLFALM